jgi:glycine oxidase
LSYSGRRCCGSGRPARRRSFSAIAAAYDKSVIVAGAGIIGLASAWRLARLGLRVIVFDAREAGAEASWAGAGMLAPGGEFEEPSEMAATAMRSLEEYPAFVRELQSESGCRIDFQQCGAFELATNGEEAEALERKAERQRFMGIESAARAWGGREARFYPQDAIVDPRHVTRALRAACARHGAALREHEPVLEIAPDGSSIRTARETISDEDGVLVAAGAWSSSLCAALPRTVPVRGHLVSWSAPPGMLPSIVRHGHTYLLQRGNGTIIAGSSTEHAGFERSIDRAIVADIRRRAEALLPALASIEPAACWNGFRPAIASATGEPGAPLIGRLESKLWAAFGHYRNGILLAPETARLVASQCSALAMG